MRGHGWAVTVWPPCGNESQEEGDQRRGITSLGPHSLAVKSKREKETEQSVTPLNRSNSNEPVSLFCTQASDALLPHTHTYTNSDSEGRKANTQITVYT